MKGTKGVPGSPGHCEFVYLDLRTEKVSRFQLPVETTGKTSLFRGQKPDQYKFEIGEQGLSASLTTGKVR